MYADETTGAALTCIMLSNDRKDVASHHTSRHSPDGGCLTPNASGGVHPPRQPAECFGSLQMTFSGMRYASKGVAGRHLESALCHWRACDRTLPPATTLNLHALITRDRLLPAVMSQAELRNERGGCIPGFCICKGSLGMSRVCPAHVALTSCRYRLLPPMCHPFLHRRRPAEEAFPFSGRAVASASLLHLSKHACLPLIYS